MTLHTFNVHPSTIYSLQKRFIVVIDIGVQFSSPVRVDFALISETDAGEWGAQLVKGILVNGILVGVSPSVTHGAPSW